MTRLTGHFDGKVIIPDGPVDLPANQRLVICVEAQSSETAGATGAELVELAKKINFPKDDLREITQAIEEGCEKIDPDGWDLPR